MELVIRESEAVLTARVSVEQAFVAEALTPALPGNQEESLDQLWARHGAYLLEHVRLSANGDLYPLLEQYAAELPALFIVSQVALNRMDAAGLQVGVERAEGIKCERCWKYTTDVGSSETYPTICGACADAVDETLNG